MSDVAPSFFPTPHEIAGGIKWVRQHPVVATAAAAAATAVSVITFLRARTLLTDDELLDLPGDDDAHEALPPPPPSRERFATWSDAPAPAPAHAVAPPADPHAPTRALPHKCRSHEDFTAHTLRKEAEELYSNTDSEFSAPFSRRNSPASSSTDDAESPRNVAGTDGVELSPTCMTTTALAAPDDNDDVDPNSVSPQWGWYVSTTPPDEYYT